MQPSERHLYIWRRKFQIAPLDVEEGKELSAAEVKQHEEQVNKSKRENKFYKHWYFGETHFEHADGFIEPIPYRSLFDPHYSLKLILQAYEHGDCTDEGLIELLEIFKQIWLLGDNGFLPEDATVD